MPGVAGVVWRPFFIISFLLRLSLELEMFHGSELTINVILHGFDRDAECSFSIDSEKLSSMLEKVKPIRTPRFLDTGNVAGVEFKLNYRIIKAKPTDQSVMFRALKKNLKVAATSSAYRSSTTRVIDIGSIHHVFSRQAVQYAGGFREQLTVFVINPDKRSLIDEEALGAAVSSCSAGYNYSYSFESGRGQSCTWVGSESYVVIDLSAGPCQYGHLGKRSGSVSPLTFPTFSSMLERKCLAESVRLSQCSLASIIDAVKPQAMGLLCSTISSAIDHVLVPDVAYEEPTFAKRVLVSILVLRESFKASKFSIDVPLVKRTIRKLLSGEQEVNLVIGDYSLHDHPMMTVAIHKAIREESFCSSTNCSSSKRFVSGKVLLKELHHTHDLLAEGLLSDHKDFFPPARDSFSSFDGISPDVLNKLQRYVKLIQSEGSRVVPVYVFSVSSLGDGLLLDMESKLDWSSNSVLVLHSPKSDGTFLPYFVGDEILPMDVEDVTQSVLAGLASSLGSIAPAHLHYSEIAGQTETDYLWAVGFHPFTPFSGTSQLSRHYEIMAQRNSILSQLHHIFDTLTGAEKHLRDFSATHIHDLHEDESDHHMVDSNRNEQLVDRLWDDLEDFRKKVDKLISNLKFSRLAEVTSKVSDLVTRVRMLTIRLHNELNSAESSLACCRVKYYGSTISLFELTGVPVALTGIMLLMVWFVWSYLR